MPVTSRPLVLFLGLAMLLTGCIGKGRDAPPVVTPDMNATVGDQNATLPDGRGESAGLLETNKTEQGVGGVEHKHDYWRGAEQIVLFDRTVDLTCPPCMPDGEGTQPKSVAYVKLGKLPSGGEEGSGDEPPLDAMVYEGADRVDVLFGAPLIPVVELAHPAAPSLFMQYRSAADSEWTEPVAVTYDTPIPIDVTPQMTDMPHSTHSLWVWRLTSDRPEFDFAVPMKVTVHKGRNVVDWPGHPDFYAEKSVRVVMQQHVTTHMSGLESFALYDSGGTWANPEKLISWGTKEIHVFINVTSATNAYGAKPTGYFLEAHNATIVGPEITFGSRHQFINTEEDLVHYEFALLVDEPGMDSPYQPESRWGIRMMATFADIKDVVGLCPGCFPYDIEYDIAVVAMNYADDVGQEMDDSIG